MSDMPSAGHDIDYTLSVEDLRQALALLLPTDRVTCNRVANLLVLRGDKQLGYIQIRGHVPADELLELFGVDA